MAGCFAETGAQLVARLSSVQRTSLENFYVPIFQQADRPKQKQTVEITGQCNVGKTTLLMEMIAKTILPSKFDGKSAATLFFVTGAQFQMIKFITILEKHIRLSMIATGIADNQVDFNQIIADSLHRILFVKCYSADDFEMSLLDLREMLTANVRYSLFVIDAIGSFYWTQTSAAGQVPMRMDTYAQHLVTRITKITGECGVLFVYTKLSTVASQNTKPIPVSYRIDLIANKIGTSATAEDNTAVPDYSANVTFDNNSNTYAYSIDGCGINWLEM